MLFEACLGETGLLGLAIKLALVLFGALKGRGQRNITFSCLNYLARLVFAVLTAFKFLDPFLREIARYWF